MFRSIRWSFLTWMSLILLVTIGGFGSTLYYLKKALKKIDRSDEFRSFLIQVQLEAYRLWLLAHRVATVELGREDQETIDSATDDLLDKLDVVLDFTAEASDLRRVWRARLAQHVKRS